MSINNFPKKIVETFIETDYNFGDEPVYVEDLKNYINKYGDVVPGSITFLEQMNITQINDITANELNNLSGSNENIQNAINTVKTKVTDITYDNTTNTTTINNKLNSNDGSYKLSQYTGGSDDYLNAYSGLFNGNADGVAYDKFTTCISSFRSIGFYNSSPFQLGTGCHMYFNVRTGSITMKGNLECGSLTIQGVNIKNRIDTNESNITNLQNEKANITYVDDEILNLQNQINSNDTDILNLQNDKANITYVDDEILNLQNQITSNDTDILNLQNNKADISYVDNSIDELIGGAPGTLDTLNEIAIALNNDNTVFTTLTDMINLKAPLLSPTFTGTATFQNGQYKLANYGGGTNDYTTAYSGLFNGNANGASYTEFTTCINSFRSIGFYCTSPSTAGLGVGCHMFFNVRTGSASMKGNLECGSLTIQNVNIKDRIDGNDTDILNLQNNKANITYVDDEILNLQNQINSNDTDILNLQNNKANIIYVDDEILNLQNQITSNDGDIVNLQNQITSNDGDINTLQIKTNNLTYNSSNNTSLFTGTLKSTYEFDANNITTTTGQITTQPVANTDITNKLYVDSEITNYNNTLLTSSNSWSSLQSFNGNIKSQQVNSIDPTLDMFIANLQTTGDSYLGSSNISSKTYIRGGDGVQVNNSTLFLSNISCNGSYFGSSLYITNLRANNPANDLNIFTNGSGDINFTNKAPICAFDPISGDNLTRKSYVDNLILSNNSTITGNNTHSGELSITNPKSFIGNNNVLNPTSISAPVAPSCYTSGNGDGSSYTTNNLQINTWNGLGVMNTSNGGTYPNQISMFLSAREGEITTKGKLQSDTGLKTNFINPIISTDILNIGNESSGNINIGNVGMTTTELKLLPSITRCTNLTSSNNITCGNNATVYQTLFTNNIKSYTGGTTFINDNLNIDENLIVDKDSTFVGNMNATVATKLIQLKGLTYIPNLCAGVYLADGNQLAAARLYPIYTSIPNCGNVFSQSPISGSLTSGQLTPLGNGYYSGAVYTNIDDAYLVMPNYGVVVYDGFGPGAVQRLDFKNRTNKPMYVAPTAVNTCDQIYVYFNDVMI